MNISVIIGRRCRTSQDLLARTMKRQKGEEKLKRRAKLAGNLGSKLYPQPFTPPPLLTGVQTTFVASLSRELQFGRMQSVLFCVLGVWAVSPSSSGLTTTICGHILKENVHLCVQPSLMNSRVKKIISEKIQDTESFIPFTKIYHFLFYIFKRYTNLYILSLNQTLKSGFILLWKW